MADGSKSNYDEIYKKIENIVPQEEILNQEEMYTSARIDALSTLKGKRVKDIYHAKDLLTDALIKFRKGSDNPNVSEDKKHKHHYYNEVDTFLKQYARQNKLDDEGMEKLFKSGKIRSILEALMTTEQSRVQASDIDYRLDSIVPKESKDIAGLADYHLSKNPELKKELSRYKQTKLKMDREYMMDHFREHYQRNLENKLNDYTVPDKKDKDGKVIKMDTSAGQKKMAA